MKDTNRAIIFINELFIKIIIVTLLFMTMIMIGISVLEMAVAMYYKILGLDLFASYETLVTTHNLHNIFALLLSVLIGIELMETVRMYLLKNIFHVEVVITVAMIAVARHVIDINLVDTPGLNLIGTGLLLLALTGGYYLIKHTHAQYGSRQHNEENKKRTGMIVHG